MRDRNWFLTVGKDGNTTIAPHVAPVLTILALSLLVLVTVGYCTAGVATQVFGSEDKKLQVPLATASFAVEPPNQCEPTSDEVTATVQQSLDNPRMRVAETFAAPAVDGVTVFAARIEWDNRMVEQVAAIFAEDNRGDLYAISAAARDLSGLPDGREKLQLASVSPAGQQVNACARD